MRIVNLTQHWSATTGGPSKYVASLQRELSNRGHHVHVITTDGGSGAEKMAGTFPFLDAAMVRRVRELAPEIVHVHGSARLLFVALVCRFLRPSLRVVFTFHTQPIVRQFLPGLSSRQRDYGVISRRVARFLLQRADLVTSVSESIISQHNEAYELGVRRYARIPSGGDPRNHVPSSAGSHTKPSSIIQGYPLLVSVGVMTWDWKVLGHLVTVRAVDELRRLYPTVMLLIAGDGPHRGVVEREVAALGLHNHVRLLGNVSPDQLLDAADIYVHMAMNEGCSLAIIEAMHAAKPIIAANAGGTPEVLTNGDTALLIDPEPGQLVGAVLKLVGDAGCLRQLGVRAREVALQQYTWAVIAEQYAQIYQTLLPGYSKRS